MLERQVAMLQAIQEVSGALGSFFFFYAGAGLAIQRTCSAEPAIINNNHWGYDSLCLP